MYRLQITCSQCHLSISSTISRFTARVFCPHCHVTVPFPAVPEGVTLWLIAGGKQKVGPFLREQLAVLAATRQLTRADLVLELGTSHWQRADSLPGLFPMVVDENLPKLVDDVTRDAFEDVLAQSTPHGPRSYRVTKVLGHFNLALSDFRILRKLAVGGMGAIYLARMRNSGQLVALKVLADVLSAKEALVERFFREIAVLASIHHPNIVTFLGAGQEQDMPFFAMEFVDGCSAASLVKQYGKLSVGDALHIIGRAAEALNFAFTHKIIHRDIKPENIMITGQGEVKITDLGLAKRVEEDLNLTDSGAGLGSPKYMAPEQARNAKHADHRSDIYALGGVLYFFLTAAEPFQGETAMELLIAKEQKLFTRAHQLNPEVPIRLDLLIDKMLARDPKYRYQSYADLIRDLHDLGLTNAQLAINRSLLAPASETLLTEEFVEILLIDNDPDDVRLAKKTLDDGKITGNLNVVKNGAEARAYLRREGKFVFTPTPNLIIFGDEMNPADNLVTLEEIRVNELLNEIPVVILANSPTTGQFFAAHGYHVNVVASIPGEPSQFKDLFQRVKGSYLTVITI